MKVKKTPQIFEMLDLFYANKHLMEKIKKHDEKEEENFEKIFKESVDKLKQK